MKQKPAITTVDRLREIKPCDPSIDWLAENNITELADAWDQCHRADWLLWLDNVLDLLSARDRHLIACRCLREMPLIDGRKVWDLLTDDRSIHAVAVAERYADGDATDEELAAAANAAADAAYAAAHAARVAAADDDMVHAARAAAAAAASTARADAADAVRTAAAAATHVARSHVVAVAAASQVDPVDVAAAASAAAAAVSYAALADTADLVREIVGNPFRAS